VPRDHDGKVRYTADRPAEWTKEEEALFLADMQKSLLGTREEPL
jgi:hypothetical protein